MDSVIPRIGYEYQAEIPIIETKSINVRSTCKAQVTNKSHYLLQVANIEDVPWSDVEETSFLLGLYIFEKNLSKVKKFVGSRSMGDILVYYYGRFRGSSKYHHWKKWHKMRSRKCKYEQKILTIWRRRELLSLLASHVSKECQHSLMEVSRSFVERRMVLEDYIYALKDMVGLNALIEAVGTLRETQHLINSAPKQRKPKQVFHGRSRRPAPKDYSSLANQEVIDILKGNSRLSKARSNGIFWEAVWPRLLAKGWHSELPHDSFCTVSLQNNFVFLASGVEKFSRKKLTKGVHYFDSISDILWKVALEPRLIDLEIEKDKDKEESSSANEHENSFDKQCHPQVHTLSHDIVLESIVDGANMVTDDKGIDNNSGVHSTCIQERPRLGILVDLNIPISPDSQCDKPSITATAYVQEDETRGEEDDSTVKKTSGLSLGVETNRSSDYPSSLETSAGSSVVSSKKQPGMNTPRQSTRSRPPTRKALEAFESGFLGSKKKRTND